MEGTREQPGSGEVLPATVEERLRRLEEQVHVLAEAVRVLAHGLEPHLAQPPSDLAEASRAAVRAHELLLSGGL